MSVGAVGAGILSELYQSLRGQGANQDASATSTTTAASATPSVNRPPLSLTAPQPPSDQTPISEAASKLIADFKSLLLNLQGSTGAAQVSPTSASATPATSATPSADAASTLANDLTALGNDLQKAGGGHHHHHHGGGGNDATNATSPTATAANSGTGDTGQTTSASNVLLSQFTQALKAYATTGSAGANTSSALSSTLLTA
jgi:hypothetical protein